MPTTPRTRRWAVLGATAALASAAFALPALGQSTDDAPAGAQPDWAGNAEPSERHAEVLAELEGLDGDAVAERLEELYAERAEVRAERHAEREGARAEREAEREGARAEREAERAERHAEREAERAERHAEVLSELEGLEGQELTEKLEELHAERHAERQAERQAERADREALRAERQADREALRADRQADGAGRGFGRRMGADED